MRDDDSLPPPPSPSPAFRGALQRRLAGEPLPPERPARLWLWVTGCATAGVALLIAALAGVPS